MFLKKILKMIIIALIVVGIAISILNFISVDNMAGPGRTPIGTRDIEGECAGDPLNC
jgi:hypothetical protein